MDGPRFVSESISLRLGMWELGGVWGLHDNARHVVVEEWWSNTSTRGSHGAHYRWFVVLHEREWRWMGPTSGDVWLVVVMGGGWVLGYLGTE